MAATRPDGGGGKGRQIADLLRKTIENGATPGEEVSAIQLAHMIVRQYGLDIDVFKAALAKIGDPPRYTITPDGFLVPAAASEPAAPAPECSHSPTGRHRMERHAHGTVPTGALYCIHCGLRSDAAAIGDADRQQ